MEIERETMLEIVVSVGAVLLFVVVMVGIGTAYGGRGLSDEGGVALLAAIAGFVLLMTGVGYFFAGRKG
jgi:hypothetical protein